MNRGWRKKPQEEIVENACSAEAADEPLGVGG